MKAKYLFLLGVALLAIDQISKIIVKLTMTLGENIAVSGSWFNIHFVENSGAAWGMELGGDTGKLLLSLFRIVACIAIFFYINKIRKQSTTPKGVIIAMTMILIGALGNLVDSAVYGMIFTESTPLQVASVVPWGEGYGSFLHGKVVDMFYFPIIETESFTFFNAIFNVADAYISVAAIYMILFQRRFFGSDNKEKQTSKK